MKFWKRTFNLKNETVPEIKDYLKINYMFIIDKIQFILDRGGLNVQSAQYYLRF